MKFTQDPPINKRKFYNLKTTHALALKFLPELLISNNRLPTKFHNFWTTETQDKIQTSLHVSKNTFQSPN